MLIESRDFHQTKMRLSAVTPILLVSLFLISGTLAAGQQPARGAVRGAVTDSSGAFLPGVTVVATAPSGQLLATAVTDGTGRYVLRALPAETVTLTFQLEGFAEVSATVTVERDAESRLVQRLELAPLSETVVVRAPTTADRPRPRFDPPPAPLALVATPVPAHDPAAVCGPAKPDAFPELPLGTIKSRRHQTPGELYAGGSELVIDGGLDHGLLVGRNLVVRRYYHVRGTANADVMGEHTAGLVQVVSASEQSSLAVVVYACDELRKGDFLASFKPEPVRDPDPLGTPAYHDAARILFADEDQTLGVPQRLMVIDRGIGQGVRVGQRFTLFRQLRRAGRMRRAVVGGAVVVAVRADSATIRIEHITDAITAGDWAAPQSTTTASRQ
jgi:hypothetical protein